MKSSKPVDLLFRGSILHPFGIFIPLLSFRKGTQHVSCTNPRETDLSANVTACRASTKKCISFSFKLAPAQGDTPPYRAVCSIKSAITTHIAPRSPCQMNRPLLPSNPLLLSIDCSTRRDQNPTKDEFPTPTCRTIPADLKTTILKQASAAGDALHYGQSSLDGSSRRCRTSH